MRLIIVILLTGLSVHSFVQAQPLNVEQKLKGFDKTMEKILKDWNVPGVGVGIVVKDKLVFAHGYGYRNLEQKQPVTANTLFQIASNTKLFTATAVGFMVEEGKIQWDEPVKKYVPEIEFYNDELNAHVTIRDMLSHRTGISRHDFIWYKSDFTRQELFNRVKYLEPSIPLRSGFLYNNLMYAASGSVVEKLSGKTWEQNVKERIFDPLGMTHSMFETEEMQKQADFMTPYYEKRDTTILAPYPFYTKQQGLGPAGAIISSINDLSHWVIAQLYNGKYNGKQVIPANIIKETMRPATVNTGIPDKYFESLNAIYGMGRASLAYKGHYRVQHGGAIGGIYSQISIMPADSIGVIVYSNGAHYSGLPGIVANIIYDKLLGLPETPWSDRNLKNYLDGKKTERQARKKSDTDRVPDTKPSHKISDYAGTYENAGYGKLKIMEESGNLSFNYNNITMPLSHYHYDRFVSIDDEINGKFSFIFTMDAQGNIQEARISLDEKEVVFTRMAEERLSDPNFLKTLTGSYTLSGTTTEVQLEGNILVLSTAPPQHLVPQRGTRFTIKEFPDQVVEFVMENGKAVGMKITYEGKTFEFKRK
ncbi:MAG: serine hydrolase [Bacteroidetes bacterium]|nr:serine hydrolase [Bacteroidota bacterium]